MFPKSVIGVSWVQTLLVFSACKSVCKVNDKKKMYKSRMSPWMLKSYQKIEKSEQKYQKLEVDPIWSVKACFSVWSRPLVSISVNHCSSAFLLVNLFVSNRFVILYLTFILHAATDINKQRDLQHFVYLTKFS